MSWIKLDRATPEKPEVLQISRLLKIDRDLAIGKLIRIWCWFDQISVDGRVDGVVSDDVDAIVGMPGLCAAMSAVKWLKFDDVKRHMCIPNFSRHNGESFKKRALKNERQARWRSRKGDVTPSTRASTTASTREEEIREEVGIPVSVVKTSRTSPPHSVSRVARASRLPDVWALPDPWKAWAIEHQPTWTPQHCSGVADQFRDHWASQPGTRGVKLDWEATWRNWVRREGEAKPHQQPRQSLADALAQDRKGNGSEPPPLHAKGKFED